MKEKTNLRKFLIILFLLLLGVYFFITSERETPKKSLDPKRNLDSPPHLPDKSSAVIGEKVQAKKVKKTEDRISKIKKLIKNLNSCDLLEELENGDYGSTEVFAALDKKGGEYRESFHLLFGGKLIHPDQFDMFIDALEEEGTDGFKYMFYFDDFRPPYLEVRKDSISRIKDIFQRKLENDDKYINWVLLHIKSLYEEKRFDKIPKFLQKINSKMVYEMSEVVASKSFKKMASTPTELAAAYYLINRAPSFNFKYLLDLKRYFQSKKDQHSLQKLAEVGVIIMKGVKAVSSYRQFNPYYYEMGRKLAEGYVEASLYPPYSELVFSDTEESANFGWGCDVRRWQLMCERECGGL